MEFYGSIAVIFTFDGFLDLSSEELFVYQSLYILTASFFFFFCRFLSS